jgi:hypothetical protein
MERGFSIQIQLDSPIAEGTDSQQKNLTRKQYAELAKKEYHGTM